MLGAQVSAEHYRINTSNRLFGPQVGLIFGIPFQHSLFEISGKIGVMANSAQQRTFLGNFDNSFIFRDSETHRRRASVLGELGFNFTHQFSRHWFARLGYNLIFVEGLALAPDQLDFSFTDTSGLTLKDSGGLFLHGFNVGITAAW